MGPDWKTFAVDNLDQDKLVLLFDMLYEYKRVFTKQYWMGEKHQDDPSCLSLRRHYSLWDLKGYKPAMINTLINTLMNIPLLGLL